jgi:hypothetical protein
MSDWKNKPTHKWTSHDVHDFLKALKEKIKTANDLLNQHDAKLDDVDQQKKRVRLN